MNQKISYKITRNWMLIDQILFKDSAKKVIQENEKYDEYNAIKSALLENLSEYYNVIKYDPKINIPSSVQEVKDDVKYLSEDCKKVALTFIDTNKMKNQITKSILNECSNGQVMKENIFDRTVDKKFLSLSLNIGLIGVPVLESKDCSNKNNQFKRAILESTHKKLVNCLTEIALTCNKTK